jgi:hypothetical protein
MGRSRKIKEEKPEEEIKEDKKKNNESESKEEESKTDGESDDLIMLVTFKDIANIDTITYAGFKASLKAKDEDKISKSELEKKLEEYNSQSAFIT